MSTAMQFLKSYVDIVDKPHPDRAKHFHPSAGLRVNGGQIAPINRLASLLDKRSHLNITFEHTLRRVWAISETTPDGPEETLLVS